MSTNTLEERVALLEQEILALKRQLPLPKPVPWWEQIAGTFAALPPELQREVRDFVEFLVEKHQRVDLEQQGVTRGWPPRFFAHTVGSIDDPTFVRQPQGEYEQREPLP